MGTGTVPINLMDYSTIQALVIAGVKAQVATLNANALTQYKAAVNDYLTNAQHIMELNVGRNVPLPMPSKPPVPTGILVVDAPATDENHLPISLVTGPIAPPAPDPQPLKQAPALGTVDVGSFDFGFHGVGGYWAMGPNDNYAHSGATPVDTVSRDGVAGTWQPVGSVIGGWYMRIR